MAAETGLETLAARVRGKEMSVGVDELVDPPIGAYNKGARVDNEAISALLGKSPAIDLRLSMVVGVAKSRR